MKIELTPHARERMQEYGIPEWLVVEAIRSPDGIVDGYGGRKVYRKRLNGYVLRVIVEETKGIIRTITVYKSRSGRYEVQV